MFYFIFFTIQTVNFTEPFYAPLVVLITAKRSTNYLQSGFRCNAVTSWVEVNNVFYYWYGLESKIWKKETKKQTKTGLRSLCYHIEMISHHFSSVFSTHLKLKLRFASKRLTAIPKIRMSSPSTTWWLEVSRKFHSYLHVSESQMRVIADCPLIYHMLTSILLMEIETYHEIDLAVNYLTLWTKKKKKRKK